MGRSGGFLLSEAGTERYWRDVEKRRSPHHPAVRAFTEGKLEFISRQIGLPEGGSLLDVGCGNGYFTVPLARKWSVTALDLSRRMLRLNPHRSSVSASAYRLPFRDGEFDVVFSSNMVYYLADPTLALGEMVRVAAGSIVVIVPNRWNPLMALFSLLKKVERPALLMTASRIASVMRGLGAEVLFTGAHGLTTAHSTPAFLLPFLRWADRRLALGCYSIVAARKPPARWETVPAAALASAR